MIPCVDRCFIMPLSPVKVLSVHDGEKKSCNNSLLCGFRTQGGTMRTNCLDCLDRTNSVQAFFALEVRVLLSLSAPVVFKEDFSLTPVNLLSSDAA